MIRALIILLMAFSLAVTTIWTNEKTVAQTGESKYKHKFKKLSTWHAWMRSHGIAVKRSNAQAWGMFGDKEATKYIVANFNYDCLRFDSKKPHQKFDKAFPEMYGALVKKKKMKVRTYYNVRCIVYK